MNTPGWLQARLAFTSSLPPGGWTDGRSMDTHWSIQSSPSPSYSNITFSGGLFWLWHLLPLFFSAALSPSDMLSTLLILSLHLLPALNYVRSVSIGFLCRFCSLLNPQQKHCLAHGGHEIFVCYKWIYHKITWGFHILRKQESMILTAWKQGSHYLGTAQICHQVTLAGLWASVPQVLNVEVALSGSMSLQTSVNEYWLWDLIISCIKEINHQLPNTNWHWPLAPWVLNYIESWALLTSIPWREFRWKSGMKHPVLWENGRPGLQTDNFRFYEPVLVSFHIYKKQNLSCSIYSLWLAAAFWKKKKVCLIAQNFLPKIIYALPLLEQFLEQF